MQEQVGMEMGWVKQWHQSLSNETAFPQSHFGPKLLTNGTGGSRKSSSRSKLAKSQYMDLELFTADSKALFHSQQAQIWEGNSRGNWKSDAERT